MSQLFASGGQCIEASASASVLPMNIQSGFPLGWTGLICVPYHCQLSPPGGTCWRFITFPTATIWRDGNLGLVSLFPKGQHMNKCGLNSESIFWSRKETPNLRKKREAHVPAGQGHNRGTPLAFFHAWPSQWSWGQSTPEPDSPAFLRVHGASDIFLENFLWLL